MSKDLTEVLRDASELSEQDRATLAGLLIESLETEEVRQRLRDRLNAR
jgi:hypothetical protein